MTVFCPLSTQPVFWQGKPQIGAQVSFYDAGTLTPRTIYGDGLLANPLAQPVLTDGNGCIPPIWLQGNPYRMRILAPAPSSVQIRDVDNLPGDTSGGPPPPPPPGADKPLTTGDLVWNYGTAILAGRVRANGKTIGNPTSAGSERANNDCYDLFIWLWNGDINLPVIGGRGVSAAADWAADKAITLPDFNGRVPFGIDGMGQTPTGRLNGSLFATGNPQQLGSTGGEGAHATTVGELPSHQHTGTTQSAGSHQHTGTTAASALIQVNEVTDVQGGHSHGGQTAAAGAYTPTGTTDAQGTHSHGGQTGGPSADHTHGINSPTSYNGLGGGSIGGYWYGGPVGGSTGGESAAHVHGIAADGNHAHNLYINALPNHTHGIGIDGYHQHNVTDTTQPHTHTFVTDPAGAHVHTLTTDLTGGGAAHNNAPPFCLVTFYLVL